MVGAWEQRVNHYHLFAAGGNQIERAGDNTTEERDGEGEFST